MHVLIIPSENFLTSWSPLGGIFQFEQAKALVRAGYVVGVVGVGFLSPKLFFAKNPFNKIEENCGVNIIRDYRRSIFPHGFYSFSENKNRYKKIFEVNFCNYVKRFGVPDLIHAHNMLFAGVIANCIKEKYGIPFVITEHSSAFARGGVSKSVIDDLDSLYKNEKYISCVSTSFARELERIFGKPVNIIHNVVDSIFTSGDIRRNDGEEFKFLSVASLDCNKNHELALRAFASGYKGKKSSFSIIGDGPLRKYLYKLVHQLGINDQVNFLGELSRNEVRAEMGGSDCLVLSSNYETFGVVLIEAMACGLPVIATRCGGPEDIVNFDNGILVDVGDLKGMELAMLSMRENKGKYSAKKIRSETIAFFGEEKFVARVEGFYKLALNEVSFK